MTTAILELNSGRIRWPRCLLWLWAGYEKGRLRACFTSWQEAGHEVEQS